MKLDDETTGNIAQLIVVVVIAIAVLKGCVFA